MSDIARFLSALTSLGIIVTAVYACICIWRDQRRGERAERRADGVQQLTAENTAALNRLTEAKAANTAALKRRSCELRETRAEIDKFRKACERLAEHGVPVPKP